jgi:hypothetical protein
VRQEQRPWQVQPYAKERAKQTLTSISLRALALQDASVMLTSMHTSQAEQTEQAVLDQWAHLLE